MNKLSLMLRWMLGALVAVVVFLSGAWGAFALWYQLPGGSLGRMLGSALWACLVAVLLALAITRRSLWPLAGYGLAMLALLIWWWSIRPSHDRVWADDVARLLGSHVHGSRVTLTNVRDFHWRSDSDYDVRWETRSYDLNHLVSTDAIVSYWSSRAIAHAMISFGFDDGRHVVFSVEIRKKRGEAFSGIGGFFKQFETILVAAEERDIVRVRTNVRDEDDYLYPLDLRPATMRALFLSYLNAAKVLEQQPAFYNTITSNCTTLVYRMARQINPGLPMDIRLLLTGYLPGYLYDNGVVDTSVPLAQLRARSRITELARASAADADFSHDIRTHRGGSPESARASIRPLAPPAR